MVTKSKVFRRTHIQINFEEMNYYFCKFIQFITTEKKKKTFQYSQMYKICMIKLVLAIAWF